MVKTFLALLTGLIFFLVSFGTSTADHLTYLPLVPNTPLMQRVITTQEYTWCVDSRAAAYPNFVSQVHDVADQFTERVGIKHRQVDYSDPACNVQHRMPSGITCSGWAGRIYYHLPTVVVEYCYGLGYTDWRSTIGHELGHGLLGLHEQYRDSGGVIQCLPDRTWTVMSCGTGVRYPTQLDVDRGCALIATSWCGRAPAPPEPLYHSCTQYPGWEGTWSCYWPGFGKWLWEIPIHNRSSLWVWSSDDPVWRCVRGCP